MSYSNAAVYKSSTRSDARVQIRKPSCVAEVRQGRKSKRSRDSSQPEATSRGRKPRRQEPQADSPIDNQDSSWKVVDSFPAHSILFIAQLEFFRSQARWDQLVDGEAYKVGAINLDVEQHQATAAQALVYWVYHGSIMPDMQLQDVAQLLVLADRYQAAEGIKQACAQQLEAVFEEVTPSLASLIDVCDALSHCTPAVSPALRTLCACFQQRKSQLQQVLRDLVARNGPAALFDKAVAVLQFMFHDTESTWGQPEFRHILNVFPAEVLAAVLHSSELRMTSENVVVAIIHHWYHEQPDGSVSAEQQQLLMRAVRTPYLTPSILSLIFPAMPWVQGHKQLLGSLLLHGTLLKNCQSAASSSSMPVGTAPCAPCARDKQYLMMPRKYAESQQGSTLEWDIPWAVVQEQKEETDNTGEAAVRHLPASWVNGVRVSVVILVEDDELYDNDDRTGRVLGYWLWDLAGPLQESALGSLQLLASYKLEFSCSAGSNVTLAESMCEGTHEVMCGSSGSMCGKCVLFESIPLMQTSEGHKLHCRLTISSIM